MHLFSFCLIIDYSTAPVFLYKLFRSEASHPCPVPSSPYHLLDAHSVSTCCVPNTVYFFAGIVHRAKGHQIIISPPPYVFRVQAAECTALTAMVSCTTQYEFKCFSFSLPATRTFGIYNIVFP